MTGTLRVLAALLKVAGTASATLLSPPASSPQFDVQYEPGRFAWHVREAVVLLPSVRFGSGSYQWSLVAGALPSGLVLGQTGAVYGAPRMPGRYSWTAAARDIETGASATATASANVQ